MTSNGPPSADRLAALVARAAGRLGGEAERARGAVPRLARYLELLLEANETTNLVSAAAALPETLVEEHLLDALRGLRLLPPRGQRRVRLLDVGSGGGFPALPLLVVRGDLDGVLVESTGKKCRFLERAAGELGLTCAVVNARFPDSFQMDVFPPFDLLTTRAVADAGRLVRRARPCLAPGARALLWTTRPLFERAVREAGIHSSAFHGTGGAGARGIGLLECST